MMQAWRTHEYGARPTEVLQLDEVPVPAAEAGELLVQVHAIPLNLNDLERINGGNMMVQPELPYSPGMEVMGVVVAAGSGAESWLGQRAAIQIAKHIGATVFATAGTDDKAQLCRDLGADIAINYNSQDFAAVIREATGGRGVEVVFDNVGEAVMEASLASTAYNGRYLMMGFASNKAVADEKFIVPRRVSLGNIKLCGVLLAYSDDATGAFLKEMMGWNFPSRDLGSVISEQVLALYRAGAIKPVIGQEVDFEGLPQAMEAMANRQTVGRTVVRLL